MSDGALGRSAGSALLRARAAAGLATGAVLLPVGGHLLAGGSLPPLRVLLLLTACLWALLLSAPARRTGPQAVLVLASVASAGQLVVHWGAGAAHEHPLPGVDGPMVLAHLAAAALTVLVLVRGEAALADVAALVERALGALVLVLTAPPAPEAGAAPTHRCAGVPVGRRLAAAEPRRGPPRTARSVPLPG